MDPCSCSHLVLASRVNSERMRWELDTSCPSQLSVSSAPCWATCLCSCFRQEWWRMMFSGAAASAASWSGCVWTGGWPMSQEGDRELAEPSPTPWGKLGLKWLWWIWSLPRQRQWRVSSASKVSTEHDGHCNGWISFSKLGTTLWCNPLPSSPGGNWLEERIFMPWAQSFSCPVSVVPAVTDTTPAMSYLSIQTLLERQSDLNKIPP